MAEDTVIAAIEITERDLKDMKLVLDNPDEVSVTMLRFSRSLIRKFKDKIHPDTLKKFNA